MIALPACDVWIHEKALFKILRLLFPCGRLSATQPQPWIFQHTTKLIISWTTAIQLLEQHHPHTCYIIFNRSVSFWLAAAAYSSQEVCIATTTINYWDSTTTIQPPRQTKHKQQPSNSQNNTIPSLAKFTSINRSSFSWWRWIFFIKRSHSSRSSRTAVQASHPQRWNHQQK